MKPSLCLAAVLALGIALSSDANAQFGKLKKMAGEKAAEKAAEKAVETAGVPTTPPKYVKKVNLTAAQLAQVNRGLAAEIAATPRIIKATEERQRKLEKEQEQYQKDMEAYQKKNEKYQACKEKFLASERSQEEALEKKAEAASAGAESSVSDEDKLVAQAQRAQEAAQRVSEGRGTAEDRRVLAEFQGTMAGVQDKGKKAAATSQELEAFRQGQPARLGKACGPEPQAPADPAGSDKSAMAQISDEGSKAADVPKPLWFTWRDEALGLAASNTKVQADDAAGGGGGTSKAEADAINAQIDSTRTRYGEMKKVGVPF
jgi:hypothetical protein